MSAAFILLATQRTGSSWVQEMLNSHAELKVYSELFLAEGRGIPLWEPNDIEFAVSFVESRARRPKLITRRYWTVRYLRRLLGQDVPQRVGFKYMYDQIRRSPEVLAYAAVARVPVVHLIRRNLLDTVISASLARASGLYHLPTDGRPQIPWHAAGQVETKIRLEPGETLGELHRLMRERRLVRAWLRASRTPTYEVQYEELAADPTRFGVILKFLGVRQVDVSSLDAGLKKLRTAPRSDVVTNFAEVESALAGTPYEAFLRS